MIIQTQQTNKLEKAHFYLINEFDRFNHYWKFKITSDNIFGNGHANGWMLIALENANLGIEYAWSLFTPFLCKSIKGIRTKRFDFNKKYIVHSGDIVQIRFDGHSHTLYLITKNGTKKIENINPGTYRIKIILIPLVFKKCNVELLSYKMIY